MKDKTSDNRPEQFKNGFVCGLVISAMIALCIGLLMAMKTYLNTL